MERASAQIPEDDVPVPLALALVTLFEGRMTKREVMREVHAGRLTAECIAGKYFFKPAYVQWWKQASYIHWAANVDRVYFIRCQDFVKIGYATDVRRRLAAIQISSPYEVTLLAECKGGSRLECELHKRFAAHRVRGEWFHLTPDIQAYIDEVNRGSG